MPTPINVTGTRFGRLIAVEPTEMRAWGSIIWLCRCDCGTQVCVRLGELRTGRTRSCGCLQSEMRGRHLVTHGETRTGAHHPLYEVWGGMKARCRNPNVYGYHNYGGRGIAVCDRWLGPEGFSNFLADMGERPPAPDGWSSKVSYWSVDRIDVDGDYEPSNCRWASPSEQRVNQRGVVAAPPRACAVEWCTRPVLARGWCNRHHQRWLKHGDPLGGAKYYIGTDNPHDAQQAALAKYARGRAGSPHPADTATGSGFHIAEGGETPATRYGRRLVDPREGVGLAPQRADFGLARESADWCDRNQFGWCATHQTFETIDDCPPLGIVRPVLDREVKEQ